MLVNFIAQVDHIWGGNGRRETGRGFVGETWLAPSFDSGQEHCTDEDQLFHYSIAFGVPVLGQRHGWSPIGSSSLLPDKVRFCLALPQKNWIRRTYKPAEIHLGRM